MDVEQWFAESGFAAAAKQRGIDALLLEIARRCWDAATKAKSDSKVSITKLHGQSEVRAWLEAEATPDGGLRLVGMGSRTDFDRDGNLVAHKCEPTGTVLHWPARDVAPRAWWRKLFGA